jgi:hypothetical protein
MYNHGFGFEMQKQNIVMNGIKKSARSKNTSGPNRSPGSPINLSPHAEHRSLTVKNLLYKSPLPHSGHFFFQPRQRRVLSGGDIDVFAFMSLFAAEFSIG